MTTSEEISAKEALEMIVRGQIGELLFRRIKVPTLDEGNRVTVNLDPDESVRAGQCVAVRTEKPREFIRTQISRVITLNGGASMIPLRNISERLEALIDVLDLERRKKP